MVTSARLLCKMPLLPILLLAVIANGIGHSHRLAQEAVIMHRQDMGLCPVLNTHVSSITPPKASNFSYHLISSMRALATSSLRSVTRLRTCLRNAFHPARQTRPIRTPCRCQRPAQTVVFQRVSLACLHQLQPNFSKLLRCLQILLAFPTRLDVHVSSRLSCPHWAQNGRHRIGEFRFACSGCLRAASRAKDHSPSVQ